MSTCDTCIRTWCNLPPSEGCPSWEPSRRLKCQEALITQTITSGHEPPLPTTPEGQCTPTEAAGLEALRRAELARRIVIKRRPPCVVTPPATPASLRCDAHIALSDFAHWLCDQVGIDPSSSMTHALATALEGTMARRVLIMAFDLLDQADRLDTCDQVAGGGENPPPHLEALRLSGLDVTRDHVTGACLVSPRNPMAEDLERGETQSDFASLARGSCWACKDFRRGEDGYLICQAETCPLRHQGCEVEKAEP